MLKTVGMCINCDATCIGIPLGHVTCECLQMRKYRLRNSPKVTSMG